MRNLSVITAVEESDGRNSSVVRRPIEIVSNPRHNLGRTVRRPLNGMGLKGKVAPLGIEPRASGLSRQCSATELRRPGFDSQRRHFSFQAHAVQRSTESAAQIVSWIRHDLYRSSDHGGVPSIGLLHSCDYT